MSELIWLFERAGERLEIRRNTDDDGLRLTVTQADDSKSYRFDDAAGLRRRLAQGQRHIDGFGGEARVERG